MLTCFLEDDIYLIKGVDKCLNASEEIPQSIVITSHRTHLNHPTEHSFKHLALCPQILIKDRPPGNIPIRRQTKVGWMWGAGDAGSGDATRRDVEVKEATPRVFLEVLRFIYTGEQLPSTHDWFASYTDVMDQVGGQRG